MKYETEMKISCDSVSHGCRRCYLANSFGEGVWNFVRISNKSTNDNRKYFTHPI